MLGELKEKGIKRVKTIIYGRTVIVVLAFLIQFALLISAYLYLREYSLAIYGAFGILGVLVTLHLFNGRENPDFKLVWILPILIFPVFGALFYLYITTQPGTKFLKKRLNKLTQETKPYVQQEEEVRERLKGESEQMSRFADYMYRYAQCPVYDGTEAVFYPLGDDQ